MRLFHRKELASVSTAHAHNDSYEKLEVEVLDTPLFANPAFGKLDNRNVDALCEPASAEKERRCFEQACGSDTH